MTSEALSIDLFEMRTRDLDSKMKWGVVRTKVEDETTTKTTKTKEDFVPYLTENLVTCLEMELDFRSFGSNYEGIRDKFGEIGEIKTDPTIHNGREIIVWGTKTPSEEFAKRLPLDNIKKYFMVNRCDSMHSHVLDPSSLGGSDTRKGIPLVIAKNGWTVFQAFYPGWVYIFGNYKGCMLRGDWAKWQTRMITSDKSDWWESVQAKFAGGMHFENSSLGYLKDQITRFDVEIRTQDGTTELDQIVSARALSKAIFLLGAKLAYSHGQVRVPTIRFTPILRLIDKIDDAAYSLSLDIETPYGSVMKDSAEELYSQVKGFLSKYEASCVKSCIENPVRNRGVIGN